MKRLFLVLGTSVMVLPWLTGAMAQAEDIHWSATESLVGPYVSEGNTEQLISSLQTQNAGLNLNTAWGTLKGTNSESPVVLAYVAAVDDSGNDLTKTFGGALTYYSLSLRLSDLASGASGSLTVRGQLGGSFGGYPGAPVDVTNTFLDPTSQTLTLGKNLYTVTMGYVPPLRLRYGDPFNGPAGYIGASISVQPLVNSTPEPSSLLLACLGLPSLGLTFWRRKVVAAEVSKA